jgi:NTE family protein
MSIPEKKNLIFKGGSIKGIAYIGVRAALEACGFDLNSIERVGGTSAGAMNALAFSLNLSMDETKRFVLDLDFKALLDDSHSSVSRDGLLGMNATRSSFLKTTKASSVAVSAAPQLSGNLGLYPGEFVRDWMETLLFHKTKIRNCTFQEFHDYHINHPELKLKDLYVVGFNLNTQVAKTFSVETTPTVIIADAIRISMSIPYLFQPHCPYHKVSGARVKDTSGHLWIDGGIVENYPVHLFDWGRYVPGAGVAPDVPCFNADTLGFYFTDARKCEFLNDRSGGDEQSLPANAINGIRDYNSAILSVLYGREYNEHVRRHDNRRTIYIDSGELGLLDFNLSNAQKSNLMSAGWHSVCEAYGRNIPVPESLIMSPDNPAVGLSLSSAKSSTVFGSTAVAHRKDGRTQITQSVLRGLIDNNQIISETNWVMALVRRKGTEHAFLLIEGQRGQERKLFRSDLFLDGNGWSSTDSIDSVNIIDSLWSYSACSGHGTAFIRLSELSPNEYDALVDLDRSEYQSWSMTVEEAGKLFAHLIEESEKERIPYHIAGDHPSWMSSASTLYYHNCVSWCQEVIREVFEGRFEVGSRWANLVKRPSDIIRQAQEMAPQETTAADGFGI